MTTAINPAQELARRLHKLNEEWFLGISGAGDRVRVYRRDNQGTSLSLKAFKVWLAPNAVEIDGKRVSVAKAWLKWEGRANV